MTAVRHRSEPSMTVADFVDWPGDGTAKHFQLVDGEPCAMSPASFTHGIIQSTLAYLITRRLTETGSRCVLATEPAVIPRLRSSRNMRVPDLGVTCALVEAGQIEMPDPVLLIEILSPGNVTATWDNIWAYASIPSLNEILVVQSTRIGAELLRRREDRSWPPEPEPIAETDMLRLESVDSSCQLRDVYARTHLA